jgi:hypothetical protein
MHKTSERLIFISFAINQKTMNKIRAFIVVAQLPRKMA